MHDITTKIHHKVGFVNGQKIVGLKSQSSEVYFWREKLDEILPGQIGHCETPQQKNEIKKQIGITSSVSKNALLPVEVKAFM